MARPSTFIHNDEAFEVCSIASSNATADNLPGPGRLLGNLYARLGVRLENGIGRVAILLGRGPEATSLKIQRIHSDQTLGYVTRRKKLRKNCGRLVQYMYDFFLD